MKRSAYLYDNGCEFSRSCAAVLRAHGFEPAASPAAATLAVAPLLRRKLAREEWAAPELGTLVFHPSALPYRRGRDAVRHAVLSGERVSGVTWFWCDDGLDTGPICEQRPVVLAPGESPGRAYFTRFVPAGLEALGAAARQIAAGVVRRVPQEEALATYDPPYELTAAR